MRIVSRQITDVVNELPDIEPLSTEDEEDLFIGVVGFEERALKIPRMLATGRYRCQATMYVQYRNKSVDNSINLPGMREALGKICSVPPTPISDADAAQRVRNHVLTLSNALNREIRVCFDMSGASVALVLDLMHALLEVPASFRICYTEAEVYYPKKEDYFPDPQKWFSNDDLKIETGVESVCISPEYPGQHSTALPNSIVIVPNFNPARSKAMLAAADEGLLTSPNDSVIWLLGVPHLAENGWRCQALREINEIEETTPQLEVSTFDYKEMIRILDKVWQDRWKDRNITLAFLGSKLQAIGAAIFCEMHTDVRVMVSSPTQFKQKRYSDGCRAEWQVRFGSSHAVRDNLLGWSDLQVLEN